MASGVALARMVADTDRLLARLERSALSGIRSQLTAVTRELELAIVRRYADVSLPSESDIAYRAYAEARARELLAQVRAQTAAVDAYLTGGAAQDLAALFAAAYDQGLNGAAALVRAYQAELALTTRVPFRHVAAVVLNSAERLSAHGQEFIAEVQTHVVQGLVEGRNPRVVARQIRESVGGLLSDAETIARTEALSAQDDARRGLYRENGIEYVQRIATQDERVCGDCADRAGNVYRVEEAPAALHPNDRCFNAPFKPMWLEEGLVDVEWFRRHAADAQRRAEQAGHKPSKGGVAAFEKANGLTPPQPLWTPAGGYVKGGAG